ICHLRKQEHVHTIQKLYRSCSEYITTSSKKIWTNEQVVIEKFMFDPLLWLTRFLIRHSRSKLKVMVSHRLAYSLCAPRRESTAYSYSRVSVTPKSLFSYS